MVVERAALRAGLPCVAALAAAAVAALLWAAVDAEAQAQVVLVGTSGRVVTTADGITFSSSSPTSSTLYSVENGGGLWVAVGTTSRVITSPDGVAWTTATGPSPSTTLYGIGYGDGTWVAVGASGRLWTSPDANTWTLRSTPTGSSLCCVDYDEVNGVFIVQTSTSLVLRSTDGGMTWSSVSSPIFGSTTSADVAHGAGTWVISSTSGRVAYSTTGGTSWTDATGPYPYTGSVRGLGHDQAGTMVAAGFDGIATSSTGASWTARVHPGSHGSSPAYQDAEYHPGLDLWFVAGPSGRIAVSADGGASWSAAPSATTSTLYGIAVGQSNPPWLASTEVTASPVEIVANGSATSTIKVQLKDVAGNNVYEGGHTVTLGTDKGSLSGVTDNNDGTYTATLTSTTLLETATLTATLNGSAVPDDAVVDFVPGPPDADNSVVEASPATRIADGIETSTVTVTLYDETGHKHIKGGHAVTVDSDLGVVSSVTDNNDGTYTALLTSSDKGEAVVTAAAGSVAILDDATVDFLPGAAVPGTSKVDAWPFSAAADGVATITAKVRLYDAKGNSLETGGDDVQILTDLGTVGTTVDKGDGTYEAVLFSTTAGTATLTATLDGSAIADSATVEWKPGPASPAMSTIDALPTTIVADGASTSTLSIALRDGYGNLVGKGGDPVVLATDLGMLGYATDHGDGTYTATLTSATTAGTATVTGSLGGVVFGDDAAVAFVAGAPVVAGTTLETDPSSVAADGASTSTVTVVLHDAYGNPLKTGGETVAVTTDKGTLAGTTDHGDGTYTAILTSTTLLETATLGVVVDGTPAPATGTVDFVPGPPSALASVLDADPGSIVADGAAASLVTLDTADAQGHDIAAGGHIIGFTTDLGFLGEVADLGDGRYAVPLRSLDPGVATVTATLADGTLSVPVDLTVPAGPWIDFLDAGAPCHGEPMDYTAVAHRAGATAVSYTWTVGTTAQMLAPDPDAPHRSQATLTFPAAGSQTVTVRADFSDGTSATVVGRPVVSACVPPVPAFASVASGLYVAFQDQSTDDGDIVAWQWDFGDGAGSVLSHPAHTFSAPGQKTVRLQVTDQEGYTASTTAVVVVALEDSVADEPSAEVPAAPGQGAQASAPASPPTPASAPEPVLAVASAPATAAASARVVLDGTASQGPADEPLRFAWRQTRGDPVVLEGADQATAAFRAPAGPVPRELAFELAVTDGRSTDAALVQVVVAAAPVPVPVPEVSPDGDGFVFSETALDGVDLTWHFGDGTTARGDAVRHAFTKPGAYTVRVVADDGIQQGEAVLSVNVRDVLGPKPAEPLGSEQDLTTARPLAAPAAAGDARPPLVAPALVALGAVAAMGLVAVTVLARRRA